MKKHLSTQTRKRMLSSIGLILFSVSFVLAQVLVKGTVKDNLGEGVPRASVQVKGTSQGTITDLDGKFAFNVPNKNSILVISFIGYVTVEMKVDTQKPMVITLKEDTKTLDEVVVVGYQEIRKKDLTGSVAKASMAELLSTPTASFGETLGGRIAGVNVSSGEGMPGGQMNIVIRGNNSLTQDNSPLYVIDGFPVEDPSIAAAINQNDIESLDFLKDASATAIYGARANGGVILVTTKRGKEGSASVSYKFKGGANFARTGYDYLNAHDYIYYNRLGYQRTGRSGMDNQMGYGIGNDLFDIRYLDDSTKGLLAEGWQQMQDPTDPNKQILFKDYSGQMKDAAFQDPSFTQDHYINITGGNDKGTFAASLGYYKEDGLIKGTSYERFSGTFNGSYKIFPILTVNAGTTYTWSRQPGLWIGSYEFFYRTMSQRPTWNPYMEDGSPASGFGTGDGNPLY